jgi:fumarate hydratase class II
MKCNERLYTLHLAPCTVHDTVIGIRATRTRRETDSMGKIEMPADRYWGAQTQRSLVHFSISDDRMPKRVYHALKEAALRSDAIDGKRFDEVVDPKKMVGHGLAGS